MKKLIQLCAVLMLAFSFSACSQNDDNENKNGGVIIDPVNWKDAEFHFNADGTMKYEASNVFKTTADMQKALVGKAFKHSFSYEIVSKTGKVEREEYRESMYGLVPYHFYFQDNESLYVMGYSEKKGGEYLADKREWTYLEDMCMIKEKYPVWLDKPKYNDIQILEYDAEYKYIWLTQIVAYSMADYGEVPVYVLSRYDLMSEEELSPYLPLMNN